MGERMSPSSPGSLYIGGGWRDGSGPGLDVFDPTDASVIATVPSATDRDVEAALTAASSAQRDWARTPSAVRGGHLRAMADLVNENGASLAEMLVREVGKPLAEAEGEVAFAESLLRYNAEWDRRLEGDVLPGDSPGEQVHLLREPIGVVAAICPWNFPLAVLCRKLAPALITGNTVVAKPSEVTPTSTIELFRLIDEQLELPAGVLGLVCGASDTGRALVRSQLTGLISFTGHRDTGKGIMAEAASNLTRVSLELGGKAPAIVCADADLEITIPAIITARHSNAGQVCTCAERVFVDARIADEFTERYAAAARALVIGDPMGAVDMGPLVSEAQLDKTLAAVATAQEEGAEVVSGGGRPEGFSSGYWHEPTVLRGLRPEMTIMREETFGPVTPILAVGGVPEAVSLANDSRYGLSAYVFSRDYGTVMRTVDELAFGEIYINRTHGESVHAHHAGYKESGMGGEDGKWGMLRYTQIKTAYHRYA
jgi:lactaldehyde dehydrogenase/glycolaldehyde dehydrogenase